MGSCLFVTPRLAALPKALSASSAICDNVLRNSGDWPTKSPFWEKLLIVFTAPPKRVSRGNRAAQSVRNSLVTSGGMGKLRPGRLTGTTTPALVLNRGSYPSVGEGRSSDWNG